MIYHGNDKIMIHQLSMQKIAQLQLSRRLRHLVPDPAVQSPPSGGVMSAAPLLEVEGYPFDNTFVTKSPGPFELGSFQGDVPLEFG